MTTAGEARKTAGTKVKSENGSPLFKHAVDWIERSIRDASSCGCRSFSYNVNALAPGYDRPDLHLRKAVAEELRKNGFSCCETQKSPNCAWFEAGGEEACIGELKDQEEEAKKKAEEEAQKAADAGRANACRYLSSASLS